MEVYRRERNCVEDDGPFVLCRRRRRRHRVTKEETSRRRQQEDQSKLSHRAEAFREVYFPNVATIENQIRTQSNYTLFWFGSDHKPIYGRQSKNKNSTTNNSKQ